MKFLQKYFLWILLFISAGLWVYRDATKPGPCDVPIKYSIGIYDSQFHISKADFKAAVDQAVEVWEDATGKNLFRYEPNPQPLTNFYLYFERLFVRKDIPVNLVYDERQQVSDENKQLISSVNDQKESAADIRQQFQNLQNKYKEDTAQYQSMLTQYKRHQISYDVLEAKRLEVNDLATEVNNLVKKYNYLVVELNSTVKIINQSAGQEFEEGQYISDEKGERINIFEFNDMQTLVRVLAHEFGHALGLEHNDNPDSIMYYLNQSSNMQPTKDDLAALSLICKGS